ncbi:MAG: PqqD family protein [Hyphomicrobium sp.]|jgi:hypothetical protein|uniref:hypothetical protein n=1 Tax=Hyphomicrobium sp. TaxID=82 RepID=UPI0025BEB76B|nr:hypothetical protein [Hyphomicrobium sp.]MBX9863188.1 PqqD family protein [Hyphomicrobium sp.]
MTNAPQATTPATPQPDKAAGMRSEIAQKWSKFNATEIAGLKDKDDLVTQVQAKYSLDKGQAQRDVDAFANGRQL